MAILLRGVLSAHGKARADCRRNVRKVDPSPHTCRARCAGLLACLVLLAAFVISSSVLFVWPASDQPQHVDAILSLNGTDEAAREGRGISLAEEGYAPVLLFSQGAYGSTPCPRVPKVLVVCFTPVPARTLGEVQFAAHYLTARGWRSLMVVPGRAQATRARLLMRRCFSGRLEIVPAPAQLLHLPFEVAYEWGALAKALFTDRRC
jgi:uncharacterized SAM-binding protein YcdF (DUF218 family)